MTETSSSDNFDLTRNLNWGDVCPSPHCCIVAVERIVVALEGGSTALVPAIHPEGVPGEWGGVRGVRGVSHYLWCTRNVVHSYIRVLTHISVFIYNWNSVSFLSLYFAFSYDISCVQGTEQLALCQTRASWLEIAITTSPASSLHSAQHEKMKYKFKFHPFVIEKVTLFLEFPPSPFFKILLSF